MIFVATKYGSSWKSFSYSSRHIVLYVSLTKRRLITYFFSDSSSLYMLLIKPISLVLRRLQLLRTLTSADMTLRTMTLTFWPWPWRMALRLSVIRLSLTTHPLLEMSYWWFFMRRKLAYNETKKNFYTENNLYFLLHSSAHSSL